MVGKISELKTVTLLLVITLLVCITGGLLYKNLSSISKDVKSSYNYETTASLIVRQIQVEIRDAEGCVKSYNLTNDEDYLVPFYTSVSLVDKKLTDLKKVKKHDRRQRAIIDSIVWLSEARFELLKKQLYLGDEKKITDELNTISNKIKESYIKPEEKETPIIENNSQQKESFFKRLFSKKKKGPDTLQRTVDQLKLTEMQLDQITGELKSTVQRVKYSQLEKLRVRQEKELELMDEGKTIMDKVRILYNELDAKEKEYSLQKIQLANSKVDLIKILSIIISITISVLLLIVSYFIVKYNKKKKEYETALLLAKTNAEDLAKTKEMFLANMSHEIKTPLNAIYGFTEQVLNTDLNHQQKEQLGIVKKSANHLIKLITDILNYSKIQSGKMILERNDIIILEELQEIKLLFSEQTKIKNIDLIIETGPDLPNIINCDLTKLKQILFNLVGNAIKFTDHGYVKLKINVSKENNKLLEIIIIDTGIGIAKDKISKLFNEYEQADTGISKKYGGTGLGLVITKKLIEHMDGSIELHSQEHKGTEIKILLPYNEAIDPDFSNNNTILSNDHLKQLAFKKILVVDDEEFNRLLLKAILSKYHLKITEAHNGIEAIEFATTHDYDLILMDINMPIKNGLEACKEIRQLNDKGIGQLPILASTAVTLNEEKISECKNAGFNGFVYKPFTENNLLETIIHFTGNLKNTKEKQTTNKITIDNLKLVANGNDNFTKEMIAIFHTSINKALTDIEEGCNTKDWLRVSELAHKIMPACKHFEAEELYSILKYFENMQEDVPDENTMKTKLSELHSEIATVNNELKLYL